MAESHWFYRKQGKKWIVLFVALFVNLLIILGMLFELEPLWGDMNYLLGDLTASELNFAFLLIFLVTIPMVYSAIFSVLYFQKLTKRNRIKPNIGHKIAVISLFVFYDGIVSVLIIIFGKDAVIVSAMFENASIFIYLGITIGLFIALYPLLGYIHKTWNQKSSKGLIVIACVLMGYGLGFSLPFLLPASNIISGPLPPKPKIIAHRGAAHLAPENTIVAGQTAVNLSVDGWEIDVLVSRDGIPFLLHDDTLKRTTNVSAEFPGRENEHSSNFTWAELQQLNAGSWFIERDPYRAIAKGLVTPAQMTLFRNAMIPSLEEAVNFTRDNGLLLDVDFKGIPSWHPNYTQYFNICLQVLKAGGIDEQVWLATGKTNWLDLAQTDAPNITTALSIDLDDPLTVNELQATGYNMTNIHHGISYNTIRSYVAAGIPINMWTVDNDWRFSQLWCLGVTFIVTNVPHKFVGLTQPTWYLHVEVYALFWIVIYLVGLCFVLALKYVKSENPAD